MKCPQNQNGSAFFIILLAIMMFAMLSYAVSQSGRNSAAALTQEQSRIAADELLSYAGAIEKTVQKLILGGCRQSQINFVTPETTTWLTNPLAPADGHCDVFDMRGGKLNYSQVSETARSLPPLKPEWSESEHWWFNAEMAIEDIGSANSELLVWGVSLKPEVCRAMNKILMSKDPELEGTSLHTTGFVGTFPGTPNGIGDDTNSIYKGKSAGCMGDNASGYAFYYTLMAR